MKPFVLQQAIQFVIKDLITKTGLTSWYSSPIDFLDVKLARSLAEYKMKITTRINKEPKNTTARFNLMVYRFPTQCNKRTHSENYNKILAIFQ